ncbi:MAG: hypothetical protein K2R98_13905 [Gemmataceae bacterium]|nr:hypothetical protein [Gemmataceae bacterium]
MTEHEMVGVEDLMPVRSRVSWGAIFAGAVIALATYLIFTLLGAAIGLSVRDRINPDNLTTGGAIWAILATATSLFLGGWVTTQCAVGENKMEAVVHGAIMWGLVLAMLLGLMGMGVRAGFSAMAGMAGLGTEVARMTTPDDWEAGARRAGVSQESLDEMKRRAQNAPAEARRTAEDPQTREAIAERVNQAAWWTLLGTALSMAAAIGGALVGAGPTFRVLRVPMVTRRVVDVRRAGVRTQ